MTTDLLRRVRSSSLQERRTVALELAKTRSEETMAELKRMVQGRRRRGLKWYNYDDQLVGIEALGETGITEALEFLSRVYSSTLSPEYGESFCTYPMQGSGDLPSYESVSIDSFRFPWARRKLGRRLAYSVELHEHRVEHSTLPMRPKEDIEAELREIFCREPHSVIQRAIRELEAVTGKTAQIVTIETYSLVYGKGYIPRNKEQLLAEYLQGKYKISEIDEIHSPQAFLRK